MFTPVVAEVHIVCVDRVFAAIFHENASDVLWV